MTRYRKGLTKEERQREARSWIRHYRQERPNYYLYELARKRAEVLSGEVLFDLRPEDIKVPKFCPVSGVRLCSTAQGGQKNPKSPTLVRLDLDRGWERDNVQVMAWEAAETLRWEQEALRQAGNRADWVWPRDDSPEDLLVHKQRLEALGCETEDDLLDLLGPAIHQNTMTGKHVARLIKRLAARG